MAPSLQFDRWAGGARRCVTFSYDDGRTFDRRLVEIFNRTGCRASFHLNSANFGKDGYVEIGEIAQLYAGHEISAHTHTHPFLNEMPSSRAVWEIMENRRVLESACGYPVRSMSWPYGQAGDTAVTAAMSCGIEYSRGVAERRNFEPPADFMRWEPTCHHNAAPELVEAFLARDYPKKQQLLYIWGHSYEFPRDDNWDLIEKVCERLGGRIDTWYATGIEIKDYLTAQRALCVSVDGSMVHNPSGVDVWISADGEAVCIPSGKTVTL